MKFVNEVQFSCEKVMKVLGYNVVKGDEDLKKTDLSLIGNVQV